MSARRAAAVVLVAIAATCIAVFGFFYFRDNLGTHYPIKVISARIFRAGQIPWWNFYDGGGQPLAGNPNTLTFYPDNILYLFLPAHVAFNLHFLLHLALAWFAMRALCLQIGAARFSANFAATMYALGGLAISATVFYNLICAVALIPFALWAVEKRANPLVLGLAFGLIGLVGEPVVVLSTAIAAAIVARFDMRRMAVVGAAIVVAIIIVSPQMIAYGEIAKEVERARGFSAVTALNASLLPRRIAEIAIGPILGFLTDPGHPEFRGRLFSTIFLGVIVIPALIVRARSRYAIVAATMLFFALGRYNPIVKAIVETVPSVRVARYPEKFAIALIVALAVIVATFIDRLDLKWRWAWAVITFVPLAACVVRGAPIDWFAPYRVAQLPPLRICGNQPIEYGTRPAREEYRKAAQTMSPIFGAVGGLRYAVNRSPEGMHSLMSRIVAERAVATPPPVRVHYLRMAGCAVEGALPPAWIVPRVFGIHNVNEEVGLVESGRFDEHAAAMAPANFSNFVSPPSARVTRYAEGLQDITVAVSTPAPALLLINQSFFRAWAAHMEGHELTTLALNIDRLGVVVPAGNHVITLRFGRHHAAVVIAWIASAILLLAGAFALMIEVRDRSAGEVERTADEDVAVR
ncbi:MAG: hypothetical protein M3041_00225 [Acidobacteriota bacterium]|nr:hypothetical protein [Acidobacteriota bacterium]